MVLGAGCVLKDVRGVEPACGTVRPYRSVVVAYLVLYAAMFVFFYPVLTGWHLSYDSWRLRMWMRSWI